MAKVAELGALNSNSFQMGGALKNRPMIKRKTPSELRGEQLKRTNVIEIMDESPSPLAGSTGNNGKEVGVKKHEPFRPLRYVGTRLDEVYPAKKLRFRMISGKENAKVKENSVSLKNLTNLSILAAKKKDQGLSSQNSLDSEVPKVGEESARKTIERCSQSTFRTVTELSVGGEKPSSLETLDMDRALKGMIACEPAPSKPVESSESLENSSSASNFRSECHLPGKKAPLDLTLKTCMRSLSSSSMNWSAYNCVPQLSGFSEDHNVGSSLGLGSTSKVGSMSLHSWVYPQSTLPPSLMSFFATSAADGAEMDFLRKRQLAWENSFRSLYFMLRKNACDIFYVCTSQLVVMFTGALGTTERCCNAYISQSTQGLRSLLKEHDISFSMPLCHSKLEQVTTEDLVELSEIEKHNLGQTRRRSSSSSSDIDNTPQSLLAFNGSRSVHGLYDFLLNYRSLLTFLTAVDVPVLYSPVPFQNAALSTPEVKCTEMKREACHKGKDNEHSDDTSSSLSYSIEIKDAYLPPWIISNICAAMGHEDRSFEASFTTVHTSVGLNAALIYEKSDTQAQTDKDLKLTDHAFGVHGATVAPFSCSGFVKGLKYCSGSYAASLSPF